MTLSVDFRARGEHAVDLETGAIVALTVQPGDRGDTASLPTTLVEAGCSVAELAGQAAQANAVGPVEMVSEVGVVRVVADKGYHSKLALQDLAELAEVGVRTVIAEPERKRQKWISVLWRRSKMRAREDHPRSHRPRCKR